MSDQETTAAVTGQPAPPTLAAIDRITRAFNNRRRLVHIEQWEDLDLYFGPLTTADLLAVEDHAPKNTLERNVLLLIHKAEHEDGTRAFSTGDKFHLMHRAEYALVQKCINEMFKTSLDMESAEKKLQTNPNSDSA